MVEVSWEPIYDIDIRSVSHSDVFELRKVLAEKANNLSIEPPSVFNKIIEVCNEILVTDDF